jgi:hypothetical protein
MKVGDYILEKSEKPVYAGHPDKPPPYFVRRHLLSPMRAPDELKDCVVFVGTKDEEGAFIPKGTAFLVSFDEHQLSFQYLVTAEHVINGIDAKKSICVRCNSKDGKDLVDLDVPRETWVFYDQVDEQIDIVLLPFNADSVGIKWKSLALNHPTEWCRGTKDVLTDNQVGIGDEVVIAGLFTNHFGHDQNIPLVRIGNIAAMAEEPVKTENYGFIDAYLVEMHSIGGVSGAPVLVSVPPYRIINQSLTPLVTGAKQFYLLGLIQGHFDIKKMEDAVSEDNHGSSGINVGIAVVSSCDALMKTIAVPELAEQRKRIATRYFQSQGAREDDKA